MRAWFAVLVMIVVAPTWAADAIVKDGDTLGLSGASFRLDGVDAPELDQVCLDEAGSAWACGIEARTSLTEFVGKHKKIMGDPRHLPLGRLPQLPQCDESQTMILFRGGGPGRKIPQSVLIVSSEIKG
jgi:hypothetical protein